MAELVSTPPQSTPPQSTPPQTAAQKLKEKRLLLKNQRTGVQRREQIKKYKEAQGATAKTRTSKDIAKTMAKETIKKILDHFHIEDEKMENTIWREVLNQSVKTEQDIFNSILRKLKLQMAEKMASQPKNNAQKSDRKHTAQNDQVNESSPQDLTMEDVNHVTSFSPNDLNDQKVVDHENLPDPQINEHQDENKHSRKTMKRPSKQLIDVHMK